MPLATIVVSWKQRYRSVRFRDGGPTTKPNANIPLRSMQRGTSLGYPIQKSGEINNKR